MIDMDVVVTENINLKQQVRDLHVSVDTYKSAYDVVHAKYVTCHKQNTELLQGASLQLKYCIVLLMFIICVAVTVVNHNEGHGWFTFITGITTCLSVACITSSIISMYRIVHD